MSNFIIKTIAFISMRRRVIRSKPNCFADFTIGALIGSLTLLSYFYLFFMEFIASGISEGFFTEAAIKQLTSNDPEFIQKSINDAQGFVYGTTTLLILFLILCFFNDKKDYAIIKNESAANKPTEAEVATDGCLLKKTTPDNQQ
jgi:hypothetical protein